VYEYHKTLYSLEVDQYYGQALEEFLENDVPIHLFLADSIERRAALGVQGVAAYYK